MGTSIIDLLESYKEGTLRNWAWLLVLLVVLTTALATRLTPREEAKPFGTDEADYVRALSFGLTSNYLGSNERSGMEFLLEVLSEYRTTGWARPFQRDWQNADAAGLRHYHPPLGLYPAAALTGAGVRDEWTLRLIPVAFGVLACLSTALLAGAMTQGWFQPLAALIAGLLVASSPYHIAASTELTFHAAFTWLSTLTLACLAKAASTEDVNWWRAASVAFGLTMLTVPFWLLLLLPYLWVGWRSIRPAIGIGRTALSGFVAIVATLLVAWPPFVAGIGFVKPLLMYGGIILKPLPSTESTSWIVGLATSHWLTLLCLSTGLASLVLARTRVPRPLIPAAIFCAGFLLVTARVAHMKTFYAGDLIGPLSALAAASLVAVSPILLFAVATAALGLSTYSVVGTHAVSAAPWRSEMAALSRSLKGTRVLVTPRPAGAMVAYYVQDCLVVLDSGDATDISALRAAAGRSEIDVVLQWGSTFEPGGVARELTRSPPDASFTIEQTRVQLTRLTQATTPSLR